MPATHLDVRPRPYPFPDTYHLRRRNAFRLRFRNPCVHRSPGRSFPSCMASSGKQAVRKGLRSRGPQRQRGADKEKSGSRAAAPQARFADAVLSLSIELEGCPRASGPAIRYEQPMLLPQM